MDSESYGLLMPVVPTVIPDGARIREVREKLGLTRPALAARIPRHRHPKTIHRIESGETKRVSTLLIREIADAMDRPVTEFIKAGEAA
jgi:transcriptional regulator with XRE-family HTH domain